MKPNFFRRRFHTVLLSSVTMYFLILSSPVIAQSYEIDTYNGQVVNTCTGTFYDSGGSGGNYAINENYSMTFCSSSGQYLAFDFSLTSSALNLDAGTGDTLYFYNGTTASGTPIAFLTSSDDVPFTQLMINTLSTCVTVVWHSDGSAVDGGWSAVISCENPPSCAGNPPASDIFGQATTICNMNNYCGTTASYYGEDLPYNLGGGGDCPVPDDGIFGGTVENNSWLAFQAMSTSASFEFTVTNCTGNGIQVGIFGFNGSAFNLVSPCNLTDGAQGGTFTVTGSPLAIGETYYIMIDGNAGANCDYVIHANNGVAVVSAGPDQSACAGSPVNLTASGPAGASFLWNSLDGLVVNAPGINQTFNPLVNTSYVVSVFGAGLCESQTDTVVVSISGTANATITPAGPFCVSDAPATLVAATGGGTWSGTGITNTATGLFSPVAAGNGTFDIIYTISGSCGASDTTTISVNALTNATITPAGPFCVSDAPVTLAAATGGGTWSGTGITNTATGLFSPVAAGNGTFDIIYTISGSCGASDTTTISVNAPANATITPAGPFCVSDAPVTLVAATGGGTWSGTGITNTASGLFSPVAAGNGTFDIIYTISGSCGASDTTTISVNAPANATITPAGPFCVSDAPVTLVAATGGGTWSGTGITNTATGLFSPVAAGNGTFDIIYTISGSCGASDTTTISVNALANATINPVGPFCTNQPSVNLTAATTGGIWSGAGITSTSQGTFDPELAGDGIHMVTYQITGNCGNTDTLNIAVYQAPDAITAATGENCTGAGDGTVEVLVTQGTAPYEYLWSNLSSASNQSGLVPGIYTVLVTDAMGCTETGSTEISASFTPCEIIIPAIYIPTIFSPNSDGSNDIFYVRGRGIKTLNLRIYDRWGELVFETSDPALGWDGTFQGQKMDDATFVYLIDAVFENGEVYNKRGNISLVH